MTAAGLGYCASLVLAVIFAVAAWSKLRDPERVAEEFDAMGIRRPGVAARLLPAAEATVVVTLVLVPWLGAAVAVAMLAGFSVVLVRQLRSGSTNACACFGASSTGPVSPVDLARNAAMVGAGLLGVAAERIVPSLLDAAVVAAATLAVAAALSWGRRRRGVAGRRGTG